MVLPVSQQENHVWLCGPFITGRPVLSDLRTLCADLHLSTSFLSALQQYFTTLPLIQDYASMETYLRQLHDSLYQKEGSLQFLSLQTSITDNPGTHQKHHPEWSEQIEKRYQKENTMMDAIARSDYETARENLEAGCFSDSFQRSANLIRNQKNMLIVANTLFRKAAEQGGLHPYWLDAISSDYAIRIENAQTHHELNEISDEMLRTYCSRVLQESAPDFSPVIRKAVNTIRIHLNETISLQNIADACSVNKSYLAARFHKETGMTVMEFINLEKIMRAVSLMNVNAGSTQDIAEACGIQDLNWFNRLFHRYMHMTPGEYRKTVRKNNPS